jgi:DNA polymerase III psi subunit
LILLLAVENHRMYGQEPALLRFLHSLALAIHNLLQLRRQQTLEVLKPEQLTLNMAGNATVVEVLQLNARERLSSRFSAARLDAMTRF